MIYNTVAELEFCGRMGDVNRPRAKPLYDVPSGGRTGRGGRGGWDREWGIPLPR